MADDTRIERDSMGEMRVPTHALYGASTQRAVEHFPISGYRFPRRFLHALGLIKEAAALANQELGLLDPAVAGAIRAVANEVASGALDDHFVVDVFQTGSGTSTNMNANEVIATRATTRLGSAVHPNDHVNMGQSSNDVIPTAMHVAARAAIEDDLVPALGSLRDALAHKAVEFDDLVKIGRTHLQDATPIRLGQEFGGYARQIELAIERVRATAHGLEELALGGTAVGTGLNTHPSFAGRAIAVIAAIMPGKVNPVMAEALPQAAAFVIGADATITVAGQAGNFELNVMMPVMAYELLESIRILANAVRAFADRCVTGITANRERCAATIEQSLAMCTALAPAIGYDAAAAIAKESFATGKTVREIARERGVLPEDALARILDPLQMTVPGIPE